MMTVAGPERSLATDRNLLVAARQAMRYPGDRATAARRIGISVSHLHAVVNGSARLTGTIRTKLILAIRDEELDLADKISAEWGWVERV